MQRIAERLMKHMIPEPNSGCWLWDACVDQCGYGLTSVKNKTRRAHRVSYSIFKGSIPSGMQIDHLCRVRCCINPQHMEVVTKQENFERGLPYRVPKSHCPHGHKYTPDNSLFKKNGGRVCRECGRLRSQARDWRRRGLPARLFTER